MAKSSLSIWRLLHTVKILSIFVAFSVNVNFKVSHPKYSGPKTNQYYLAPVTGSKTVKTIVGKFLQFLQLLDTNWNLMTCHFWANVFWTRNSLTTLQFNINRWNKNLSPNESKFLKLTTDSLIILWKYINVVK